MSHSLFYSAVPHNPLFSVVRGLYCERILRPRAVAAVFPRWFLLSQGRTYLNVLYKRKPTCLRLATTCYASSSKRASSTKRHQLDVSRTATISLALVPIHLTHPASNAQAPHVQAQRALVASFFTRACLLPPNANSMVAIPVQTNTPGVAATLHHWEGSVGLSIAPYTQADTHGSRHLVGHCKAAQSGV
jgi:hypothetical protein